MAGDMRLEDLPDEMSAYTSFAIEDYVTQVGTGLIAGGRAGILHRRQGGAAAAHVAARGGCDAGGAGNDGVEDSGEAAGVIGGVGSLSLERQPGFATVWTDATTSDAVMPTIAFFYGIAIRMYIRDHSPPHFHALYG